MAETIPFDLHVTGSRAVRMDVNQQTGITLFMDKGRAEDMYLGLFANMQLSVATDRSFSLEL